AQAVNGFLNDDLLASVDPSRTPDRNITMLAVLDTASRKIEKGFAGEPVVAASVRRTLGRTFAGIGVMDSGERHLRAAIDMYRSLYGPGSLDELKTQTDLGGLLYNAGQL